MTCRVEGCEADAIGSRARCSWHNRYHEVDVKLTLATDEVCRDLEAAAWLVERGHHAMLDFHSDAESAVRFVSLAAGKVNTVYRNGGERIYMYRLAAVARAATC